MKANEFLSILKKELSYLAKQEQSEILDYYEEMINDAIESGKSEKDFIASLGPIDEIARNIRKDTSLLESIKARTSIRAVDVFSVTVKSIGYFFFAILLITVVSVGFSFAVSGISLMAAGGMMVALLEEFDVVTILFFVSLIVFGFGFLLLGVGMLRGFIQSSKGIIQKLFHRVDDLIGR